MSPVASTSRNFFEDVYLIKNSLALHDIEQLITIKRRLENNPFSTVKRAADTLNRKNYIYLIKEFMPEYSLLQDFVRARLPFPDESYIIDTMNFYTIEKPYALHCDNLGPDKGFYQVIIPLEIKPQKQTYTILFDQTSDHNTEWIAPAYKKSPDYKPFHNIPIYDPTLYPGWTDEYKISSSDGQRYWGASWDQLFREAYKGFSIKYAYEWSIGDVFIFNSHFNHCSSDLIELGVHSKTGLLICLMKQ